MKVQRLIEIDVKNLGKKIKKVREKDGRTLKQICKSSNISESHWRRIEAEDNKSLPINTLRRIEETLGVDFEVSLDK